MGRAFRSPVSLLGMGHRGEPLMIDSCSTDVRFMAVDRFGQQYRRYRLPDPEAETAMVESLHPTAADPAGRLPPGGNP